MRLGFGCSRLGSASGSIGRRATIRLVHEAVDEGVIVFDTADAYSAGASERLLGAALRGRRAGVVIATKGGYRFRPRSSVEQLARRSVRTVARLAPRPAGPTSAPGSAASTYRSQDFSPAVLRQRVEASLRRLRTDYIDVYQLHGPHEVLPDVIDEVSALVDDGKVRRFGVGAESVADARAWAGVDGVEVVQLPFGVLDPEALDDVFPITRARGVEVWARGVFGGGLLTAHEVGDSTLQREPKLPLIAAVCKLSEELHVDFYELAMDFVRAHGDVSTVVVGISSPDHLRRNLSLLRRPAPSDEIPNRVRALFHDVPR